jgi:hypothetical protein
MGFLLLVGFVGWLAVGATAGPRNYIFVVALF